jgi:hypothetical protein
MRLSLIAVLILSFILFTTSAVFAQEQEEEGNVFAISTFKIRFDQRDDFLKYIETENKPIYDQNEHIISFKVLTHLWGEDWTVVTISEYKSMAAIEAAQEKTRELFKQKYPDEEEREKMYNKRRSMIMGHTDNIVQEVSKLSK